MTTVSAAGAARADAREVQDYLLAFWKFRTADTTSFLLYTVAPIMVPYAVFAVLIKRKTEAQLEKLERAGDGSRSWRSGDWTRRRSSCRS